MVIVYCIVVIYVVSQIKLIWYDFIYDFAMVKQLIVTYLEKPVRCV